MEFLASVLRFILRNFFFINILLAVLIVFFERRKPTSTWLWLMVLVFLPIVGFFLYLFIGQDLRKQKLFARKEKTDLTQLACKYSPMEGNPLFPKELSEFEDMLKLQCSNDSPFIPGNKVELFHHGHDKFDALLENLCKARHHIHIQYYIFRNDNLGRKVIKILAERAQAGVEVRLLYDGMGGIRLPKSYFKPLLDAGGKVACFFPPFLPYLNIRVNYRNHRKICVIDGSQGWVGGFNIGDEYLGLSKKFAYWRDTHIRIQGQAVHNLQWRFMLDWQFASEEKHLLEGEEYFPPQLPLGETGLQIVTSGPDSKWPAVRDGYYKMIADARESLYIHTPYFIPDEGIFEALRIAALSGVDVRVIIPGRKDHPFVWWASLSFMGELLEAGVKCYTYNKGFMHSKVLVADGKVSSVGTANLDIRSFQLNFEVNAFIFDPKISAELKMRYLNDIEDCTELTMERYKDLPASVKIRESVSRLLSPLL